MTKKKQNTPLNSTTPRFAKGMVALAAGAAMALGLSACGGGDGQASGVNDSVLSFDASKYTTINVTIDGGKDGNHQGGGRGGHQGGSPE